jgi:hypothetical protein
MAEEGEGQGTAEGEGSTSEPSWTDSLSEETRGYIESKGIKTPDDLVKGWKNAEGFVGTPAERLLRLPEKMDEPGALDEIYARLGRPGKAEEYEIPTVTIGKGDDGVDLSESFKEAAHGAGLTTPQATKLAEWYNGLLEKGYEAVAKQREEQGEADLLSLKTEWGESFDSRVASAKRAARALGWSEEQTDEIEGILGTKQLMKSLALYGANLGEHAQPGSDRLEGGGIGMSVAEARARFQARIKDEEFMAKVESGDVNALREFERLSELAAQAKDTGGPPSTLGG